MKDLPTEVAPAKRTREFTHQSVPAGLLRGHRTRAGTWGKIVVLEGGLVYRILEPEVEEIELDTKRSGIIEPAVRHEVETRPNVRFYIQFYEREGD